MARKLIEDGEFVVAEVIPMPGDIIFVGTNPAIYAFQFGVGLPEPDITHVAVMAGSDKIVEAMKGVGVKFQPFGEWKEERNKRHLKDSIYRVWRSPHLDVADRLVELYESATDRHDQGYDLSKLIDFEELDDQNTVCSTLALNVLLESGALKQELWHVNAPIFPGQLMDLLRREGFVELEFEAYEHAVEHGIGGLDAEEHGEMRNALFRLDTEISDFLRKTRGFSSLLKKTPPEVTLLQAETMRRDAGKSLVDSVATLHGTVLWLNQEVGRMKAARPPGVTKSATNEGNILEHEIALREHIRAFIIMTANLFELVLSNEFHDYSSIDDGLEASTETNRKFFRLTGLTPTDCLDHTFSSYFELEKPIELYLSGSDENDPEVVWLKPLNFAALIFEETAKNLELIKNDITLKHSLSELKSDLANK